MYLYSVGVGVGVNHVQMGLAHSTYQMDTDGVITVILILLITMISIIINVYTNCTGIHVVLKAKLQSTCASVCVWARMCASAHV